MLKDERPTSNIERRTLNNDVAPLLKLFKVDGTFRITPNYLWVFLSSFNRILAFVFVFYSTFDVGRSMFDVHLLRLNGDHLDRGTLIQPLGVDPDFNQSVGFYHCVYKP